MSKKIKALLCSALLSCNFVLSVSAVESDTDEAFENKMEVRDSLNPESLKAYNKSKDINFNIVTGRDRYETSINISKKTFHSSRYLVLVNGDKYPDSISSIAVSAKLEAPIILTRGQE